MKEQKWKYQQKVRYKGIFNLQYSYCVCSLLNITHKTPYLEPERWLFWYAFLANRFIFLVLRCNIHILLYWVIKHVGMKTEVVSKTLHDAKYCPFILIVLCHIKDPLRKNGFSILDLKIWLASVRISFLNILFNGTIF